MTFKTNLEKEVKKIFASQWKVSKSKIVPTFESLSPGNDAKEINATVLYADMADSTDLVDNYNSCFAAEIYKAYLRCAATIINTEGGKITAYDGDRVMAVFLGDAKNDSAVRSAMKINDAVHNIINPFLEKYYSNDTYRLKHVIGIDTGELFVTRTGVRKDSDLVWVGRAANYAAKLCSSNDKYPIYITEAVFDAMGDHVRYGGENNVLMWNKNIWKAHNHIIIYSSNYWWPID
jgi:class 3 adenylate cyclase